MLLYMKSVYASWLDFSHPWWLNCTISWIAVQELNIEKPKNEISSCFLQKGLYGIPIQGPKFVMRPFLSHIMNYYGLFRRIWKTLCVKLLVIRRKWILLWGREIYRYILILPCYAVYFSYEVPTLFDLAGCCFWRYNPRDEGQSLIPCYFQ